MSPQWYKGANGTPGNTGDPYGGDWGKSMGREGTSAYNKIIFNILQLKNYTR